MQPKTVAETMQQGANDPLGTGVLAFHLLHEVTTLIGAQAVGQGASLGEPLRQVLGARMVVPHQHARVLVPRDLRQLMHREDRR